MDNKDWSRCSQIKTLILETAATKKTKHNIILRKKQSNYNIAVMKKVDG